MLHVEPRKGSPACTLSGSHERLLDRIQGETWKVTDTEVVVDLGWLDHSGAKIPFEARTEEAFVLRFARDTRVIIRDVLGRIIVNRFCPPLLPLALECHRQSHRLSW